MLRRHLAYRPEEVAWVYRMIDCAAGGCPGHGAAHLLVESAAEVGFQRDPDVLGWERPGLPALSTLAGPVQHFRAAILEAWRNKVSAGFRVGPLLDFSGTLQFLTSSNVRERDKALLRSVLVGCVCVWNGFLLSEVKGQQVSCRFCGGDDGDGHLFWDCTFPPLVEIRQTLEFHDLMEMDKSCWPRCLLWHGWLPMLSGVNRGSPWAEDPAEGAGNLLESALGAYTSDLLVDWQLPVGFDAEGAAERVPSAPDVWTDGRSVEDKVFGVSSSGSGFLLVILAVFGLIVDGDNLMMMWVGTWPLGLVVAICSVPGSLQNVQRAEFWGVILALQAADGVHLGVDNLGVVRYVVCPPELVKDGNLSHFACWWDASASGCGHC